MVLCAQSAKFLAAVVGERRKLKRRASPFVECATACKAGAVLLWLDVPQMHLSSSANVLQSQAEGCVTQHEVGMS